MSEQCHCLGCGLPRPAGPFCTQCWGNLPMYIRERITAWRNAVVHGTAEHQAAIGDAVTLLHGGNPMVGPRAR